MPSESSEPTPYLPIVKAIAPKAPIGATFMMKPTIANSTCELFSMKSNTSVPRPPKLVQREAEQHREQQHLQDLALGEGVDHRARDHVEQEVGGRLHLARPGVGGDGLGVERRRVDVHARARLHQVDDHQADDQRDAC